MSTTGTNTVSATLDAHTQSIDDLHAKLAAIPGMNQERLAQAVDKFKSAAQAFHDDALGCMN
jgi:hypothetical protein